MLFDTFAPTLPCIIRIFLPNPESQNQSHRAVFCRYIPWHRKNMKKGNAGHKTWTRRPLRSVTAIRFHRSTPRLGSNSRKFLRRRGCLRGEGRVYAPTACLVVDPGSAVSHARWGLCTEHPTLKALLPSLRASQASSSGSLQKSPSARGDPGGRTLLLPLHPGLRIAWGW